MLVNGQEKYPRKGIPWVLICKTQFIKRGTGNSFKLNTFIYGAGK
jgi:hypothetical protein